MQVKQSLIYLHFCVCYTLLKQTERKESHMNIGKKISERRKELGITQEVLAEKLSLSAQAVSKWENGWNLPDIENIRTEVPAERRLDIQE